MQQASGFLMALPWKGCCLFVWLVGWLVSYILWRSQSFLWLIVIFLWRSQSFLWLCLFLFDEFLNVLCMLKPRMLFIEKLIENRGPVFLLRYAKEDWWYDMSYYSDWEPRITNSPYKSCWDLFHSGGGPLFVLLQCGARDIESQKLLIPYYYCEWRVISISSCEIWPFYSPGPKRSIPIGSSETHSSLCVIYYLPL